MNSKLKPALLVGLGLGLLLITTGAISSIPALRGTGSYLGCCNCLWPIVGGLLATFWYIKGSSVPATVTDGAIIGALAGLVGGLMNLVIGLPIQYFISGIAAITAQMRQFDRNLPVSGIVLLIIGGIIGFIIMIVLSVIGGLIAVPIFEKRKGDPNPPPPPQGFGGEQPGSGAAA